MVAVLRSFKAQATEADLDFDVLFDPDARFHCLVGKNGVGKTHLIEHIARTLLYTHAMFVKNIHDGRRYAGLISQPAIQSQLNSLQMRLAMNVELDGAEVKSRSHESWHSTRVEHISPRASERLARPLVFVGARERGHMQNVKAGQVHLLGTHQDQFIAAFRKTWRAATGAWIEAEEPADWFISRAIINPTFVVGNDNDFSSVLDVLELLEILDPVDFRGLVVRDPNGGGTINLVYQNGALLFMGRPIDKLATGYIAVLKIFQEIIAGYSGWAAVAPDRPARLSDLDGVVFIDELEAHLHPRWQASIVGVLKRAFPNTTFFVTTHSPLVVRQTDPGEAVEIMRDGDKVTSRQLGSPRDWYLADLYSEGFHVDLPLPGQDAPNGARPLSTVMLEFSDNVREHATAAAPAARTRALELHAEIDARLAPDDPRRRSLDMLRELLR